MEVLRKMRGITLVALIVMIIVLLILAGISIQLIGGSNGLLNRASSALDANDKATATEKMELKITYLNMVSYGENTRKATLQELADGLCADEEMQYVLLESQKTASLAPIEVGEAKSIFTKLKKYPYEFEIDENLQLASVDGVKVATTNPANEELKESMANMQQRIGELESKIASLEEMISKVDNKEIVPKMFIDFDNLLTTITTQGASWEATEDCAVIAEVAGHEPASARVCVNGVVLSSMGDGQASDSNHVRCTNVFYVKKGSVITTRDNSGIYNLKIYGLKN